MIVNNLSLYETTAEIIRAHTFKIHMILLLIYDLLRNLVLSFHKKEHTQLQYIILYFKIFEHLRKYGFCFQKLKHTHLKYI